MTYTFYCFGHENIQATHKNTIEFTKEDSLTKNGDCIVGVKADFDRDSLVGYIIKKAGQGKTIGTVFSNEESNDNKKNIIEKNNGQLYKNITIKITITAGKESDAITGLFNQSFQSNHEMVLRLSDFASDRTVMIRADKSAVMINSKLRSALKDSKTKIIVSIEVL